MSDISFFEGQYIPTEQANLGIKNHSFLYGTAIFEGIRGYWLPETGQVSIFRMKEHYERILANSRIFYMTPEASLEQLMAMTEELARKNAHQQDFYIRFTIYKSGSSIGPFLDKVKTDYCAWTQPLGDYVNTRDGLHVCVSAWRRVDDNAIPPAAKASGAYMNTAIMITDAKRKGFDEVISLTNEGHVSEGSAMNVFLVRKGKLVTPPSTENILEGVTRDSIMTLAREELGLVVEERVVDRTELYRAEEIFFTGTAAQVAPVTMIEHRPVGHGKIGPITQRLQDLYFDVVRNKVPKYSHWCSLVDIKSPSLK
ncbi:branched-chain amino acid transaminase [Vampirovibrio chlorellavorus]|uniref:branched-chain amino acid transaminase n=1 Tax=Vampirovibrio chlorellavorus TaxID=758823 RepID=UPI0026EFB200|nr:branched-chain amino acid transaminase [Vampirovibrio chlorellavorus]